MRKPADDDSEFIQRLEESFAAEVTFIQICKDGIAPSEKKKFVIHHVPSGVPEDGDIKWLSAAMLRLKFALKGQAFVYTEWTEIFLQCSNRLLFTALGQTFVNSTRTDICLRYTDTFIFYRVQTHLLLGTDGYIDF